jgi:uncharacterized protein (DUF885 family)
MSTSSLTRRQLFRFTAALISSGAATACGRRAGLAGQGTGDPAAPSAPSSTIDSSLTTLFEEGLKEEPALATSLGWDRDERAGLRRRWMDRSTEAARANAARYSEHLARLRPLADQALGDATGGDVGAAIFALELAEGGAAFSYGDQSLMPTLGQENTPYVINQMIGLALSGPQLLAQHQPLAADDDVDAFRARLAALPRHIDAETARLRHDLALGVCAPRFVLATLAEQLATMTAQLPASSSILAAIQRAASGDDAKISAAARAAAPSVARSIERELRPAVARQLAAVRQAMTHASDAPGVKRLPQGEAYYAWALRVATTTAKSAAEIHALGLELSRDLASRMDQLLRGQGLSGGSVGERLLALGRDQRHRFANTDLGRAEAIAYCNQWLARTRAALPRWSSLQLRASVEIQRVPPEIEAGAAGAYMAPGAIDGSRPSVFSLNLRDTALWPRWALPTLVVHETLPGHAWQEAYEAEVARRHPLRSLLRFNAYSEGWALYAEKLAEESDFFRDDPLAQLGYLQAQQLRATRLVVDTGLHAFGWSRQRAVHEMVSATGRPALAMQGEVDRYCVKPGQACGYMIGQEELLRLRARWQATVGPQRPLSAFNDAVLAAGNLPLTLLARALE